MGLITCKDCKKEFSSDAAQCVHCGASNLAHQKEIQKGVWYLILGLPLFWFLSSWELPKDEITRPRAKSMADYPQAASVRQAYNRCMIDSLRNGDSITAMYAICGPSLANAWCEELGLPNAVVSMLSNPSDERCFEITKNESDSIVRLFGSDTQKAELNSEK